MHPKEKILGTRMRKGPLPYVGMDPLRMVNPALVTVVSNNSNVMSITLKVKQSNAVI